MKQLIIKYYPFIPIILCCLYYITKAINFPIHDFSNYYFGGKLLLEGKFNEAIYFPYKFNKIIVNLGYQQIFASYAPNTPFLAFVFLPFAYLPIDLAKIILNCISTFLFVLSIYKLFIFYKIDFKYILILPILFFIPIKNNLLFGQVYLLLFFLLTEFCLAYEKNKIQKASFFLSLSILLKVFPILFVFCFIFKKELKPFLYTLGYSTLLLITSLLFTGFDIWFFFIQQVLPKASNGEIATSFVNNYQSVYMFLKELMVFDTVENSKPLLLMPQLFLPVITGLKIFLLITGYYISKNTNCKILVISYWIVLMQLISPYGSTYSFIILIIVFIAIVKSNLSYLQKCILATILFLVNNIPLSLFIHNIFPLSYIRLFLLLVFSIYYVLVIYENINWRIVALSTIIISIGKVFINYKVTAKSTLLLQKNSPILIYDYHLHNNSLTYSYWNENGENDTTIKYKLKYTKQLEIKNNEIFYNGKLISDELGNKQKPVLVDSANIIYLSDYNRGIGFYTLRKIKIR